MDSESLKATEELGARGATHPRVTLDDINAAIASEYYCTADKIAGPGAPVKEGLGIFTICILVMKNGYIQLGYSAPASPENFDSEKGRVFARENAVRALWPVMGFALRDRLAAVPQPAPLEEPGSQQV